ncbi:DUF1552 domain-containing protein [Planctellipticum variicoloris]|uniref:DUF1552 domain-containing protein n=1 Tax=Planctellipticum variicoloris TaxID=3064265 RepID=UPI003013623B|nr:DUF1552 domain-containing protein [Planctomycetaceae bacterium SH412]
MTDRSSLNRRTFLQGAGALVGLPLLEAFGPRMAFGAGPASAPLRTAFVFFPNGAIMPDWNPEAEGRDYVLPATLQDLAPIRDKFNVLTGLSQDNAKAKGDGPGDHARSAATFLTGEHPTKTAGADIKAGVSVDQVAAQRIGQHTRLPSLEIGTEGGRNAGQCDSGYSCAYSSNISWKTPSQPMAKEINPRLVFERMFGKPGEEKERRRREFYRQSILDAVAGDAQKLQPKLGATDRRKLEEYFTSVREIEQRIERSQAETARIPIPEMELPRGVPKDLDEHLRLMYDLLALAFQTDTTRIATYMVANEGSNRSYPMVGVNDGHHHLSHHQNKQELVDQIKKIDKFLMSHFARFLQKLDGMQEGDGTLLDHSMIVYGSAIGDGNRHNHNDLPILLAGRGNGSIATGRHVVYPKDTPLNNLFLSMLDRMEAGVESLGDSSGRLTGLEG